MSVDEPYEILNCGRQAVVVRSLVDDYLSLLQKGIRILSEPRLYSSAFVTLFKTPSSQPAVLNTLTQARWMRSTFSSRRIAFSCVNPSTAQGTPIERYYAHKCQTGNHMIIAARSVRIFFLCPRFFNILTAWSAGDPRNCPAVRNNLYIPPVSRPEPFELLASSSLIMISALKELTVWEHGTSDLLQHLNFAVCRTAQASRGFTWNYIYFLFRKRRAAMHYSKEINDLG